MFFKFTWQIVTVYTKTFTPWRVNMNVIYERRMTRQIIQIQKISYYLMASYNRYSKQLREWSTKAYKQWWVVCYDFYATIYTQCGRKDTHRMDSKKSWAQWTYSLTIMIIRREHLYHFVSRTISLTSSSTKLSFPNSVNPTVACKKTCSQFKF